MWKYAWAVIAGAAVLLSMSCGGDDEDSGEDGGGPTAEVAELEVTSSAFEEGGAIPEDYSCDGRNHSPPLAWSEPPSGTVSQAIIMDDPDAGGYVHWVVYDLEPGLSGLERVGQTDTLPGGGTQGENSRGDVGYFGPCPPGGETHTYVMRVYALDTTLGLEPGASRDDVEEAMEGHVLAAGELRGTFGR